MTDSKKQPCIRCGGKGIILKDITREIYPNRAARRKVKNEKIEKWLPCPDCRESR